MKKLSFLALAAVGLLLGACSSDNDATIKGGNGAEEVDQYVTLAINLPTTSQLATRSDDTNDQNYTGFELNDGLDAEYAVKDAMLIVFRPSGSNEDDATFVGAFDINTDPWTAPTDKQVTKSSAKIVTKVGGTVADKDLGLVVLNRNSLVKLSDGNLTVGSSAITVGTKYKAFRETVLTTSTLGAKEMKADGFYMTNAPLTTVKGSTSDPLTGAKIRTLIPLSVYQTETEASSATPNDIYVERGMAKVTLQAFTGLKLGTTTYDVTFVEWTIDQTNTKSYTVRSTEGHSDFLSLNNPVVDKYRYAGISEITAGHPGDYKFRTYFAKDPNYGANVAAKELTQAKTGDYTTAVGDNNPQYCFENTFDVDRQTVMNTTLARLKVTVGDGTNLYIVNENRGTILTNDGVVTLAKNAAIDYIASEKALGHITVSGTVEASDFDVTVPTTAGDVTATIGQKSTLAPKITSGSVTDANLQAAVNASLKTISCYAGGTSYYTIRIKHFGDELTPWHTGDAKETPQPEVGNIYPSSNALFYLGRYGVLRNNWYDLKINSFKYLGEPTPKDYSADPTTDDELDGYLSVQVHILSWAKRTQSWDL